MTEDKISIFDSIDKLKLSRQPLNCLIGADIRLIVDLVQHSEPEMLQILNSRLRLLNEIKEALSQLGLSLNMKVLSLSSKERSELIEKLTAKHKQYKLRCQEIEKKVNALLDSYCAEFL